MGVSGRISEESRKLTQMELLCKGKDELLSTNVYIHVLSTLCTHPHTGLHMTTHRMNMLTPPVHITYAQGKTCTWKCSHTVYSTHTYTPHTCSQDILSHMYTRTPHSSSSHKPPGLSLGIWTVASTGGWELSPLCTTEYPGEVAFALEHEGQV